MSDRPVRLEAVARGFTAAPHMDDQRHDPARSSGTIAVSRSTRTIPRPGAARSRQLSRLRARSTYVVRHGRIRSAGYDLVVPSDDVRFAKTPPSRRTAAEERISMTDKAEWE